MLEISQEWLLHITPFRLKETTTPSNAEVAPNWVAFYAKDNGSGVSTLCYKNDAGTEVCLPTTGSIVTGTGVSGRVAFWNGTTTLSSDADMTFSVDTLTVTKIIGSTSITDSGLTATRVTFAGTGGLLSDNANFLFLTGGGPPQLLLGRTSAFSGSTANAELNLSPISSTGNALINLVAYGTGAFGNTRSNSARGTVASPTASQTDDILARFSGAGFGATVFNTGARGVLDVIAAENMTDTANGTYLALKTTAIGATTLTERFRIGPSGQLGIGGATFGTALDVFTSGGAAAAPTWTSPGALTKVDDTNVTLTLGGTPTTALLRAASLTLGWTGQLAVGRGGTGATAFTQGSVVFAGASGVYSQDNSNFFYDATNHRLGVGTTSPSCEFHALDTTTNTVRGFLSEQVSNDAGGAQFVYRKSLGGGTPALTTGTGIVALAGQGHDGTGYSNNAVNIRAVTLENWDATHHGVGIDFRMTPPATITLVTALSCDGNGDVVHPQMVAALASDMLLSNTTTFADISGLSLTVTAGKTYRIKVMMPLSAVSGVSSTIKIQSAGTATATIFQLQALQYTSSGSINAGTISSSLGTLIDLTNLGSTSAWIMMEGVLVVNAGGTFKLQAAQHTADAVNTTTILRGTCLTLERLAA